MMHGQALSKAHRGRKDLGVTNRGCAAVGVLYAESERLLWLSLVQASRVGGVPPPPPPGGSSGLPPPIGKAGAGAAPTP